MNDEPSDRTPRVHACAKRIRAFLDGQAVVDTTRALFVWERPQYPTYYVPAKDLRAELIPTGRAQADGGMVCDVRCGRRTAVAAALHYPDSSATRLLRGTVRLNWAEMDEWLEEDEPVYTHARDPYTRVDILHSSRHVRIDLDGVTLADSRRPTILYETNLPPRYYLPLTDLRTDLLRPSTTVTHCPYKGAASYWSAELAGRTHADIAWTYRAPLPESAKITGLTAFYAERADLYLDGQPHPDLPRHPGPVF